MEVHAFTCGPLQTNAYLLVCKHTRAAAFVDPAPGSSDILAQAANEHRAKPEKILLTHSHLDHIADVAALKKRFSVKVYIHAKDAPNLEKPGSDGLPLFFACEPVAADILMKEGDQIAIGELRLQVLHTPGHTPGGVCFYEEKEGVLLSGDTLFHHSIGNLSLPTSKPELMWDSLDKLTKLPAATQVYPGHGPPTTIGKEDWLPRARELFGGH